MRSFTLPHSKPDDEPKHGDDFGVAKGPIEQARDEKADHGSAACEDQICVAVRMAHHLAQTPPHGNHKPNKSRKPEKSAASCEREVRAVIMADSENVVIDGFGQARIGLRVLARECGEIMPADAEERMIGDNVRGNFPLRESH